MSCRSRYCAALLAAALLAASSITTVAGAAAHNDFRIEIPDDYVLGDSGEVGGGYPFPRRYENAVRVNYGGRHPFEEKERLRRRRRRRRRGLEGTDGADEDGDGDDQNQDDRRVDEGAEPADENDSNYGQWGEDTSSYRPLRIVIKTKGLQSSSADDSDRAARLSFLTDTILPQASQFWSSALRVFPAADGITVRDNECFRLADGEPDHHDDTDFVVVVVEETKYCEEGIVGGNGDDGMSGGGARSGAGVGVGGPRNANLKILAGGSNCQQDQYDRPTVGLLLICPDTIDLSTEKTRSLFFDTVIHEFAHILGFMWMDFAYYYDRETGLPQTPNREKRSFNCVDGVQRDVIVPGRKTITERTSNRGVRHFEIVTPTVRNVVRNHFGCPKMLGARLENQPTISNDCFGSHWDEVLFSSELLSSVSTTAQQYLSPVTLALFEDTGWYVPDYSVSSISPFGHGLGCRFVAGPCVVDGQVPAASKGVFCSPAEAEIGCSPDHRMAAACNLVKYSQDLPREFQYFDDPQMGGALAQIDYCPVYIRESFVFPSGLESHIDCTDSTLQDAEFASPSETFGPTSRCIETGYNRPYCFRTTCNEEKHLVEITVTTSNGEFNVECTDGKTVTVPWILDLEIRCPSLARICPDMVCPAHCSGRGRCDWSLENPECRCNDLADSSPICANSPTQAVQVPTVSPRPTTAREAMFTTDPPVNFPGPANGGSSGCMLSQPKWILGVILLLFN